MPEETGNVVLLEVRPPSLQRRVKRKREVLQGWLDHGIPHDKLATLPTSLNEARKWKDADLGIHPIGSPNNFTSRHPDVGPDVEAIGSLLTKLQEKVRRPRSKKRSTEQRPAISVKEIEQAMAALISQLHMARNEASTQRVRADTADKHLKLARAENKALEEELARLRRQAFGGLSVVE